MYNIFNNTRLQEWTEKAVKSYLKAPSKYKRAGKKIKKDNSIEILTGFPALVEEVRSLIFWQMCARCEYEICVGDLFSENKTKIDCYTQALPNVEIIARECVYQYRQHLKELKKNADK